MYWLVVDDSVPLRQASRAMETWAKRATSLRDSTVDRYAEWTASRVAASPANRTKISLMTALVEATELGVDPTYLREAARSTIDPLRTGPLEVRVTRP